MTAHKRWIFVASAGALVGMAAAASVAQAAPAAQRLSKSEAKALLDQAEAAMSQESYAEAKPLYQKLLQESDQADLAAQAQRGLGQANLKLLLSPARGAADSTYTVKSGDALSRIARKSGITLDLLKASNGLTSDIIRVGQVLRVPQARFSIVVDKSQNLLTLKDREEVVKVYRCSTGREGITPVGQFKITHRMVDPAWKGIVPPGDPNNPLGSRWLGFDLPQYGIHGTSEPDTIGQPVTRGCIRLVNADVEELYKLLPEGTEVMVVE